MPAPIPVTKEFVGHLGRPRCPLLLQNGAALVYQHLSTSLDNCFYCDDRRIPYSSAAELRLEDLNALVVVLPAAALEVGEGASLLGVAGAALVVDLVEEVGLGVFVEVVAVGEDVAHDREPVLAGGFRGGGVGGRGRCGRGSDGSRC